MPLQVVRHCQARLACFDDRRIGPLGVRHYPEVSTAKASLT